MSSFSTTKSQALSTCHVLYISGWHCPWAYRQRKKKKKRDSKIHIYVCILMVNRKCNQLVLTTKALDLLLRSFSMSLAAISTSWRGLLASTVYKSLFFKYIWKGKKKTNKWAQQLTFKIRELIWHNSHQYILSFYSRSSERWKENPRMLCERTPHLFV